MFVYSFNVHGVPLIYLICRVSVCGHCYFHACMCPSHYAPIPLKCHLYGYWLTMWSRRTESILCSQFLFLIFNCACVHVWAFMLCVCVCVCVFVCVCVCVCVCVVCVCVHARVRVYVQTWVHSYMCATSLRSTAKAAGLLFLHWCLTPPRGPLCTQLWQRYETQALQWGAYRPLQDCWLVPALVTLF